MTLQFLFDFFLGLINSFATGLTWLTTALPYIGISPLDCLTFTGIEIIIGFLLVRLVVGG